MANYQGYAEIAMYQIYSHHEFEGESPVFRSRGGREVDPSLASV